MQTINYIISQYKRTYIQSRTLPLSINEPDMSDTFISQLTTFNGFYPILGNEAVQIFLCSDAVNCVQKCSLNDQR